MYARITGVGAYIPERRITNQEIAKIIETSDAWIQQNIGVKTRSLIAPGETIADMGTRAAAEAIERSSSSHWSCHLRD
jgi:3-oxoacyl-[acyl-carrier-protein] synthase-3